MVLKVARLFFSVVFLLGCSNSVGTISSFIKDDSGEKPSEDVTPTPAKNDIEVTTLKISNITTSGFDVELDFDGDENSNSVATLYYCNQTDTPLCAPTGGDSITLSNSANKLTGSVSSLVSPYDSGDVLKTIVTITDADGVSAIATSSKVTLGAPVDAITLNDFQIFNTTGSSFDVNVDFTGDANDNSTATLYYCDRTASSSCDPLSGESVTLQKFGTTYRATVNSLPAGYDAGDELNVLVQFSDSDGTTNSPSSTRVTLVSNLSDYPDVKALIALWKLNESPAQDSTTIVDATGKHNGTLDTSDAMTDKSDTGVVGQALALDGNDDQVLVAAHSDFDKPTGAKMTFMGWYSRSGTIGADIASGISTGASNSSYGPIFDDATTIAFWDGVSIKHRTAVSFNIGDWHHYTVTFDSGNIVMYWDGVEVASGTVDDTSRTAFDFRIAGDNYGFHPHLKVDEVSFWKRVLTPQEINEIYQSQKP